MSSTSQKKVLFVGECVLDIIHVCESFPEEDGDVRSSHGRWQAGGNATNDAVILSLLGESCELLTTFPQSEMFQFVINSLKKRGIDLSHCLYYDCEPHLSSVILSKETGTRTIIHDTPNLPYIDFRSFQKLNLADYKWIHFEGRNPDEFGQMMRMVRDWPGDKITISLDLEKLRTENLTLVQYADIVFLGKDFARHIGCPDKTSAVHGLKDLESACDFSVICPWGTEGVAALDRDGNFFTCSSYPPEKVIDTLGAGDTFCGSAIYGLVNGKSLKEAIEFASRIAGAKCGFYGYDGVKAVKNDFWK